MEEILEPYMEQIVRSCLYYKDTLGPGVLYILPEATNNGECPMKYVKYEFLQSSIKTLIDETPNAIYYFVKWREHGRLMQHMITS